MKQSIDAILSAPMTQPHSESENDADNDQQLVRPFVMAVMNRNPEIPNLKRTASEIAAASTSLTSSAPSTRFETCVASSVCAISFRPSRLRRRTCGLEHSLQEEGLIRLVFGFLDVRDHQLIKTCCRSWMRLMQTLALDRLEMSAARSPLTTATLDRAFVSVLHNYSTVRHIDLSGQRSLCDRDLLVITSCFWSHLEHVTVDDCLEITDFGLLSIFNAQSQRLRSISMRHCKHVTGAFGQQQVAGRHPTLTSLDFTDTRVGYDLVEGLECQFPSLSAIHATHTPAHLEFFERMQWQDLVNELDFLVSNEMSDLPHVVALIEEFTSRASRHRRRSETAVGSPSVSVFHRTLLASGPRALVDVPLKRGDFMSALLYACENGLTNVIPALVTHGVADVEATDKDGASALSIAVTNGLTDVSRLLLGYGADVNRRTQCLATPLYIATEMNWDDVIELLLACKASATCAVVGGATALCVAAKNGSRKTVLRLIEAELDQHCRRSELRERKLPHSARHVQALFLACERGFVDIVQDILDHTDIHANVLMDNSVAPLYLACQMGHDGVVALLLERYADPNFRRPNGGVSCLYIAAQEGKHHIVQLLVRHGVNIHARMDDLSTALHIAARMGHTSVAQVLLREGAKIDEQTRSGLSPLYIASEEGHLAMVLFFLQQGADINLQTKNGTSPLFVASQKSHTQVVRALLMAGANAHLPKNNGTYPMDAASLLGNRETPHSSAASSTRGQHPRPNGRFVDGASHCCSDGPHVCSSSATPRRRQNRRANSIRTLATVHCQ